MPVDAKKTELLLKNGVESQSITLGVRPEHVTVGGEAENSFEVKIEVNEMMGSEFHLHCVCPDGERMIVRVPTLALSHEERLDLSAGNTVRLSFGGVAMHLFSQDEHNLVVAR